MMNMQPSITFIGVINSPLKAMTDCPQQEHENAPGAEIVVYPEFAEGIADIQAGADILLLTWLHAADRSVLSTKPRNNPQAPLTGVFSTRSPDRPNPIGIHVVKVVSINTDDLINVSGLEVLDQTPLIDIKPVLRQTQKLL